MINENKIYNSRFLKEFTLAVLQTIEKKQFFITEPKIIINADLIPKLSEEIIKRYGLNDELIKKLKTIETTKNLPVQIQQPKISQKVPQPKTQEPREKKVNKIFKTQSVVTDKTNGYEKIKPLINDYSVSRIQCIAPNKPLIIICSGQKMPTRIILNQNQIHDVFEEITNQAHIPLIEGPIKILSSTLTLNGINSKLTDSKFIIQKQTAYSMLEEKTTNKKI